MIYFVGPAQKEPSPERGVFKFGWAQNALFGGLCTIISVYIMETFRGPI